MATRTKTTASSSNRRTTGSPDPRFSKPLERRMLAFAEQLGQVVGAVHTTAEGWMDKGSLGAQLASVRDGATELLRQLAAGAAKATRQAATKAAPRSTRAKRATTSKTAAGPGAGRAAGKVSAPAPGKRTGSPTGRAAKTGSTGRAGTTGTTSRTAKSGAKAATSSAAPGRAGGRSGGRVDAPGKRHRAPAPSDPVPSPAAGQEVKAQRARTAQRLIRRRGRI